MENLEYRKICFLEEVNTAIQLLKGGMGELQKIGGANDFYHAPTLLLSSGYERLLKSLLCVESMDDSGNKQPFKKSHDLDYLLNILLPICTRKNYSAKFPAAKGDIDFLNNDKMLKRMLSLLSNFGREGRYYNINIVLGKTPSDYEDTKRAWNKIEMTILRNRKGLLEKASNINLYDKVRKGINSELIITLEKFARALSRLFTLADFGDFAKQASPLVNDYLMLTDNDLGTTDYRIS